jgi:hypothetical protein
MRKSKNPSSASIQIVNDSSLDDIIKGYLDPNEE